MKIKFFRALCEDRVEVCKCLSTHVNGGKKVARKRVCSSFLEEQRATLVVSELFDSDEEGCQMLRYRVGMFLYRNGVLNESQSEESCLAGLEDLLNRCHLFQRAGCT